MRVSQAFKLGLTQPELEFIDVDIKHDTKAFIDPHAFKFIDNDWADECVALLQDFFGEVLQSTRDGDDDLTALLLSNLHEPRETRLGLSRRGSDGSGISTELADRIFEALSSSRAVATGLVSDIEDTVLFVPSVNHDRISDMTTNIVRSQLIEFTQEMCAKYEIPMSAGIPSGPMWNRHTHSWVQEYTELPLPGHGTGKLLLVPKWIVRKSGTFDPGEYLTHYVLPYLRDRELLNPRSRLVQRRTGKKNRGERYVTKKSIKEERIERLGEFEGKTVKPWNVEATEAAPEILENYHADKRDSYTPPDHGDIAAYTGTTPPDFDALLQAVLQIPTGKANADNYHRAVERLLTVLFYPSLDRPKREQRIHEGRKRIDIMYTNVARDGFFHWLHAVQGVPSGHVVVECKNYTGELSNPEFDQLTGRFSDLRGKIGLLCYRGFADEKARVVQHCRDAALDGRGFVIALDDNDLKLLVAARQSDDPTLFGSLMQRFLDLI